MLYIDILFPYYFDLRESVKYNVMNLYEEFYATLYITFPKNTDSPDSILFNFKLHSSAVVQERA